MKSFPIWAAALSFGCAAANTTGDARGVTAPVPVWVRSHNRSVVDVYLLCGDKDARWLGEVPGRGADALDIPAGLPYCVRGLNFFLVVRNSGRGYWAGPVRLGRGTQVELVIEKYAGLSSARVLPGWR